MDQEQIDDYFDWVQNAVNDAEAIGDIDHDEMIKLETTHDYVVKAVQEYRKYVAVLGGE